jgi:hypothetical protein
LSEDEGLRSYCKLVAVLLLVSAILIVALALALP